MDFIIAKEPERLAYVLKSLTTSINKLHRIKSSAVGQIGRMQLYHIGHCFGNLRGAIELKKKGYYDMDDVDGMIAFFHGLLHVSPPAQI